jgi:hypothetical protein
MEIRDNINLHTQVKMSFTTPTLVQFTGSQCTTRRHHTGVLYRISTKSVKKYGEYDQKFAYGVK